MGADRLGIAKRYAARAVLVGGALKQLPRVVGQPEVLAIRNEGAELDGGGGLGGGVDVGHVLEHLRRDVGAAGLLRAQAADGLARGRAGRHLAAVIRVEFLGARAHQAVVRVREGDVEAHRRIELAAPAVLPHASLDAAAGARRFLGRALILDAIAVQLRVEAVTAILQAREDRGTDVAEAACRRRLGDVHGPISAAVELHIVPVARVFGAQVRHEPRRGLGQVEAVEVFQKVLGEPFGVRQVLVLRLRGRGARSVACYRRARLVLGVEVARLRFALGKGKRRAIDASRGARVALPLAAQALAARLVLLHGRRRAPLGDVRLGRERREREEHLELGQRGAADRGELLREAADAALHVGLGRRTRAPARSRLRVANHASVVDGEADLLVCKGSKALGRLPNLLDVDGVDFARVRLGAGIIRQLPVRLADGSLQQAADDASAGRTGD